MAPWAALIAQLEPLVNALGGRDADRANKLIGEAHAFAAAVCHSGVLATPPRQEERAQAVR